MKRLMLVLAMVVFLMIGGYVAIEHTERFYHAMTYLPIYIGRAPVFMAVERIPRNWISLATLLVSVITLFVVAWMAYHAPHLDLKRSIKRFTKPSMDKANRDRAYKAKVKANEQEKE